MGATVEYGIRINVGGNKIAADGIDQVTNATVKMGAAAEDAGQKMAASQKQIGNSTAQLTIGQQLFIEKIREQAATIGMSRAQLLEYQAAQVGVTNEVAQSIAKINEATEAQGKHSFSMGSALAKIEMLRIGHDALIGSYSRMASSAFVLGNATGVTTAIFSAAAIPVIALAAAVGGVIATAIIARNEIKGMNDSLTMTGNYAGQNASSMIEMSKQIGAANHNIGMASDVLVGLAKSGAIGEESYKSVATAATLMAKMTGQSAEDSVKEFAKMEDGVTKFAQAHDQHYHDIKTVTMEHIRALEDQGKSEEAQRVAADAIADATQARLNRMRGELTTTAKSWDDLGTSAMNAWQEMKRAAALAIGVAPLQQELAARQDHQKGNLTASNFVTSLQDAMNGQDETKRIAWLQNKIKALADADAATALDTQINVAGNKAEEQLSQNKARYDRVYAKQLAINDLKRKFYDLSIANDGSKLMNGVNVIGDREHAQVSGGEYDKQLAGIEKDFAAKSAKAGSDASKAMLDGQLQSIKDSVAAEKEKYDQLNRLADLYHKDGMFSDGEFYAAKRANFEAVAASEIAGYDKQIADLKAFHGKTEVARTENLNKIAQVEAAKTKVAQEYADKRQILEIEEVDRQKAIISASDDAINKYISGLEKEASQLEAANLGHEVSKSAIEREQVARLDLAIAYQQQFMAGQAVAGATQAEIDQAPVILKYLQDQRDLRERIAKGLDQADVDAANKKAADAAAKSWDSTAKHIETTLADAVANGAGNAWKKVKAAIASQVLQVPLQMVGAVGASLMNPMAAQAQGLTGGISGGINMLSTGKSLWDGFSGGMTASLGGGISAIGSSIGSAAVESFGTGMALQGAGFNVVGGGTAVTAGASIGAAIPYVAVATAIAAVLKLGFGHGARETVSQGIEGSFGSNGFSGDNFQNWKEKGGWFTSDNTGETTTDLSGDTIKSYTQGFDTLKSASAGFAKSLGLSADSIDTYSKKISVTLTGNTAEDTKAISDMFAGMSDDIAKQLLTGKTGVVDSAYYMAQNPDVAKNWKSGDAQQHYDMYGRSEGRSANGDAATGPDYSYVMKAGETYAVTLQRLATSLSAVNAMFDTLNVKLYDTSITGGDMASKLADLFGGLANMQTVSSGYFQSYYSDQEKVDIGTRQLSKTFADLGFVMPATKDALRAMIEAQDMSTDAGRKAYMQLMNLSGAFSTLSGAADQLAQSAAQAAQAAANTAAAAYFATIDRNKQVASLTGDAGAALNKFFGTVTDGTDANLSAAQAANAAAKTAGDNWRAIANSIRSALDSIQGQTEQIAGGYEVSMARFQTLTTLARGGDADSAGKLSGAANAFLAASESKSVTFADYLRDRYKIENSLTETLGSTTALASAQDLIVQNTSATVGQLTAMNATLTGFAADVYELLQKGYQGSDSKTATAAAATLATMTADYQASFAKYKEGDKVAYNGGSIDFLANGSAQFTDASGKVQAYLRATDSILDVAKQSPEIRKIWEDQYGITLPAFAAGGSYQGGLALVGEQGPELINFNQPGHVYTASQTRNMMGGSSNTDRLERLVEGLTAEVQRLQSIVAEGNSNTRQLADQFDEVSEGGNSIRTAITEDMSK